MQIKKLFVVLAALGLGTFSYGKGPSIAQCEKALRGLKNCVGPTELNSAYGANCKKQDKLAKEFAKCKDLIQSFETEFPCDVFDPGVDEHGGYSFRMNQLYKEGKKPEIPEKRLPAKDWGKMEYLRLNACMPYFHEHPTLARCAWVFAQIKKSPANKEQYQREVEKCTELIQPLEKEIPCDILNPAINDEGEYVFSPSRFYKDNQKPGAAVEKLPNKDRIKIEQLRLDACMPYLQEHPSINRCEWLLNKIEAHFMANDEEEEEEGSSLYYLKNRFARKRAQLQNSLNLGNAKEDASVERKTTTEYDDEFKKCVPLVQSMEEDVPCDILNHNVDEYGVYVFSPDNIYKEGKAPDILVSPEAKRKAHLRFYACIPQWEEEKRLEELEKEKLEQQRILEEKKAREKKKKAYFAKCPKGITTTSFDCYQMNKKFVNYGFRGNEFKQWDDRNIFMLLGHYPSDTQIYETEGNGGYMKVTVSHGIIVGMTVGFPPAEGSPRAIHLTMKKRFPNLKENSRGVIVTKTGGIEFNAYIDGGAYTIDYESSLREKMLREEEQAQLKKETQKASNLF